jgi:beta-lactamase regulating signal transducer with metallopeptidase domain
VIPLLTFSVVCPALVFLAGRKDAARDPRLTMLLLILLGAFPLLASVLPVIMLLPSVEDAPSGKDVSCLGYLIGVWSTGFALAMIRLLRAASILRRWTRQSVEVGRIQGVSIREMDGLQAPVAAGIWTPVILVPETWREWPDGHKRVVLEHELAHHARRDPLWRLLAEIACGVHWYHPLARWMKHRFIMQCEYACDSRVLEKGIDPRNYASVLCDFASKRSPSLLAPAMADSGSLESRILRMLKPSIHQGCKSLLLLALLGVLAACSLGMIGREAQMPGNIPAAEVELRWNANPFPAEP